MTEHDETTDEQLRALLLGEVPPARDGYWADVDRSLTEAAATEPTLTKVAAIGDTDISVLRPMGMHNENDAQADDTKAYDIDMRTMAPERRVRRLPFAAAAALLLIAALVGGLFLRGRTETVIADGQVAATGQDDAPRGPSGSDHWHAVYGVWDCTLNDGAGDWVPHFGSHRDMSGIHSHDDGLIHIHPFESNAQFENAQLALFMAEMGVQLDDSTLVLDDGRTLSETSTTCGGEPVQLHLRRWATDSEALAGAAPAVITDRLSSQRFLNDREVWVIAVAPLDAEIPLPPAQRFMLLQNVAPLNPDPLPEGFDPLDAPLVECDEAGNCTFDQAIPAPSIVPVPAEFECDEAGNCTVVQSVNRGCPPGYEPSESLQGACLALEAAD